MRLVRQLRVRPRLLVAISAGTIAGLAWPADVSALTRYLLGWNVGVWLYLALLLTMMLRADTRHLQRHAIQQADSRTAVLLLAVLGTTASMAAIALDLAQAKEQGGHWSSLLLTLSTVSASWLFLPAEFALAYAGLYHSGSKAPHGLEFPGDEAHPDYMDFMYFSITVAATSQTSDVVVSARPMRRLVLLHSLLSFAFNTGVLALTINILAGLIS
ncbi:MAG: DUF1345 domain-containing protein [Burkholderiaceae bacterium]